MLKYKIWLRCQWFNNNNRYLAKGTSVTLGPVRYFAECHFKDDAVLH